MLATLEFVRTLVRRTLPGAVRIALTAGLVLVHAPGVWGQEDCRPLTQDTFPAGSVWWKVDPERAQQTGLAEKPEGKTDYLVVAVRPDGILILNRESRYPRLLAWTRVAQSLLSTDGRRTWQRGCKS